MMIISQPKVSKTLTSAKYSADINSELTDKRTLFFELTHAELIKKIWKGPVSSDALLVALVLPAMHSGEDIYVEGDVDSLLLKNLNGPFQTLVKQLIPHLKTIKIEAKNQTLGVIKADPFVTGFSGGVDSFCTVIDYFKEEKNEKNQIGYAVFNNYGSHGKDVKDLFERRFKALEPFVTDKLKIPFVSIDSNISTFYDDKINFVKTHTVRNAITAFLLQDLSSRFIYSSAYHYKDLTFKNTKDMSSIDPFVLDALSSSRQTLKSAGLEYTRVDKTIKVSQYDLTYDHLDVCMRGDLDLNCGKCEKCLRTLFTFEILGSIDKYKNVFVLENYYKNRTKFISKIIGSTDPMALDIKRLAKSRKFEIPIRCFFLAIFTDKFWKRFRL